MRETATELHAGAPASIRDASFGERVRATFLSPGTLADLIRERPRWLDVLLVSTAVAIAAAAMLPPESFLDATRDAVTRRGAPVEITSPPEEIIRWGRYMAMFSAAVGHPLVAFTLAGVLTLAFTIVPRGRNTFMQHVALASHGLLIAALGSVASIVLRYLTGEEGSQISLALLAPFVDRGSGPYEFLALVSPFTIWMLIMVALGVARLDPDRSRATSAAVLVGGYLAVALVLAA